MTPEPRSTRAHIVLNTFGSLGDLHPYIALGEALRARGHRAVLVTHGIYRGRVEAAGVEFADMPPDYDAFGDLEAVLEKAMDLRNGSRYVLQKLVLPWIRESTHAVLDAARGADLIVGHPLGIAAALSAEKLRIPYVHAVLQPMAMFSRFDPPLFAGQPLAEFTYKLGPGAWRVIYALARFGSRPWFAPVDRLRAELGLPRATRNPMLDPFSDVMNLALFSRELMAPQPDWPANTVVTGFPWHDRDEAGGGMPADLAAFLAAGPEPLVFTLGSSAVFAAGRFYEHALAASRALGMRAVLLCGPDGRNRPAHLRDGEIAVDYCPHSEIFPRAAAIVHQGGVGTTGQALRSGRPMLIMPYSHDQPDNAARCERLGVARSVPRSAWTAERAEHELRALLADRSYAERAAAVGARVRAEGGAAAAAEALERLLAR